jgi:hypothetical protein
MEDGRLARPFLSPCDPEATESLAKRETPNEEPALSLSKGPMYFRPYLPLTCHSEMRSDEESAFLWHLLDLCGDNRPWLSRRIEARRQAQVLDESV